MTGEHLDAHARSAQVRLFVRRLPDVRTLFGERPFYEVGSFTPGVSEPVDVKPTKTPGSVLVKAGVHTTDTHDYVENANRAWTGGVGPWRGIHPDESP